MSLDSFLTDFYPECFLKMFHGFCKNESVKCPKWYFWQISDSFQKVEMTAFWHILKFGHISDPFPKSFLDNSDTFLQLTDCWQLYDPYLTYIWQSYVTDCFLRDFSKIYDRFLKVVGPTLNMSTRFSYPIKHFLVPSEYGFLYIVYDKMA